MTAARIDIRSAAMKGAEVSWFAPICNGDDAYLGERSDHYKSNWGNASAIATRADQLGYNNILCPSSYQVGQDSWTFASAVASLITQMSLLPAVRCGELHPPMLARSIATLDHMLQGRLTLNMISSNMPGESLPSADRYQRSREVIEILRQCWTQEHLDFRGQFYDLSLDTRPVKPYQQHGGPLLYFGGYSDSGVALCAEHCDVYLMWPETKERLHDLMSTMSHQAATFGRQVDFGLRVHLIVRESETLARAEAQRLMSRLDDIQGADIRDRAQDAKSYGVSRQQMMREGSDQEGYVERHLWTGIGRARSGCGAALVGNPDQILSVLYDYMDMGIRSFIFSGYPHLESCDLVARYILPGIEQHSLAQWQGRIPEHTPDSPLGRAKRI